MTQLVQEGDLLWTPSAERIAGANVRNEAPGEPALYYASEGAPPAGVDWAELAGTTRVLASRLQILLGVPADQAANRNAMANPDSLDFFVSYAATQRDYQTSVRS